MPPEYDEIPRIVRDAIMLTNARPFSELAAEKSKNWNEPAQAVPLQQLLASRTFDAVLEANLCIEKWLQAVAERTGWDLQNCTLAHWQVESMRFVIPNDELPEQLPDIATCKTKWPALNMWWRPETGAQTKYFWPEKFEQ